MAGMIFQTRSKAHKQVSGKADLRPAQDHDTFQGTD